MKGILKYYEPDEEFNFPGKWVINHMVGTHMRTYRPCGDTMRWIEENNPPKETEVEFSVICDCHYNEDTNTGHHEFVGKINR